MLNRVFISGACVSHGHYFCNRNDVIACLLMCSIEAGEVRRSLRRLEERLGNGEDVEVIRKNFNELICLLDSPLFCHLMSIEDALAALLEASHDRSLVDNDFDIDPNTGNLVLVPRETEHHKSDSDSQSYTESSFIEPRRHVVNKRRRPAEEKNVAVALANEHVVEVHANLPDEGFSLDELKKLAPGCTIESITLDKLDGAGSGLDFGIVGLRSESAELGAYVQNIQRGGVADK